MQESRRSNRRTESEPTELRLAKLPRMSDGETSIDHISALPDSVLQHILSHLQAKDIVKTSILSRRWRSVWAEVPVLRFFGSSTESRPGFEDFVSKTLANYRGNKVQKLRIKLKYSGFTRSQVDEWICFATERRVEELNLVIFPELSSCTYYLSQSIYTNSSLRILKTISCNFNPRLSVSWTSLQVLCISRAKLYDDAIASILLGSPNLQYLKLTALRGVDKIIVTSSNMKLKELALEDWSRSNLDISAPHIHSFTLIGSTRERMIRLINLSSLMELKLGLRRVAGYESLTGIVNELHRVQKLSVNSIFLQILSTCQKLDFPLPLKCKSLLIDSSVKEWDFHGIVTLLQVTPYLSHLEIHMDHFGRHEFDEKIEHWESLNTDVNFDHLTTVVITGFEQSWCGPCRKFFTSMVKFLLKNATVLKKMVIYAQPKSSKKMHKKYKLPDLYEVKKMISSYPRAPVVVFKTYFN